MSELLLRQEGLLFVVFFLGSAAAIAGARRPWVRRLYVAFLLTLIALPAAVNTWDWPFFTWNLYGYQEDQRVLFHELRLADIEGRELRYDPKAVSPVLATPLRRHAGALASMPTGKGSELCHFFLEQGVAYRQQLLDHGRPWQRWLRFPPHQFGYSWTPEDLTRIGEPRELRVVGIILVASPDGRRILERRERILVVCG